MRNTSGDLRKRLPRRRSRGWTLLELLAVIGVLGLLASLLLAAVSSVRRSASDVGCRARLMQVGLACTIYSGTHSVLPPGEVNGCLPFTAQVLPYLEQQEIYDQLNFSTDSKNQNLTCSMRRLACFVCPEMPTFPRSGGGAFLSQYVGLTDGESSYVGCMGSGRLQDVSDGLFSGEYKAGFVKLTEVADGLSKTAMVCEKDWRTESDAKRTGITGVVSMQLPPVFTEEQYFSECLGKSKGADGWDMPSGWLFLPYYNHAVPPNRSRCVSDDRLGRFGKDYPASSRHDGHVNLCFADGHVIAVADAVDPYVWRLLGGRADGVPADGSF